MYYFKLPYNIFKAVVQRLSHLLAKCKTIATFSVVAIWNSLPLTITIQLLPKSNMPLLYKLFKIDLYAPG